MTYRDLCCKENIDLNPNLLIPWYLMASYMYYTHAESIISDELYDEMCQRLLYLFPTLTHQHKRLVDVEALKAGTGYHMKASDYPPRIRCAAWALEDKGKKHDTNPD